MSPSPWTHLPREAVSPVAVDLPLTDGSDQQTLPPPQLLALFDDVMPQFAGARGAAQALGVQLAEDPHAHFCRQHFGEVVTRGGFQGGSWFAEEKHGRRPRWVMLHNSSNSLKQPGRPERLKEQLSQK